MKIDTVLVKQYGMKIFFSALFFRSLVCFGQPTVIDAPEDINALAERAQSFVKTNQTDSASFYFDKAIEAAKNLEDSSTLAALLVGKGKVHETAGNYRESVGAYFEGLTLSKQLKDTLNEGLCYLGLSNVNFRVANNEGAWQHGLMATKRFESLNDTAHFIAASMLVGQIEISLGKLDDA
nr:hypothetical protein [Chryseolinea sp.]